MFRSDQTGHLICHRLLVRHLTDLHEMWDMIKLLSTPRF